MVALTFMINLLCAVVSCEGKYGDPEIAQNVDRNPRHFRTEYPTVWTSNGALKGYTQTSSEGRHFYAFESVPYGQAPIGRLRFRSPQPIQPWSGVREAMTPSPLCLQLHPMHLFRIIGQEDCLFLNIYTPRLTTNQNQSLDALPVIVAFHGGSFLFGGASELGAAYWLNKDVVLITINHRLGPLGFLSTGDEEASGNWGLKDQALAIKWIRDNVQNFGGDPFNLNLMGYSSGAVSVHQQLIYNLDSRPNFASAASLSGTSFVHWAIQPAVYARHLTDRLGRLVHCPVNESGSLVACLRSVSPYRLVAEQMNLFDFVTSPPVLFIPTVEPASLPDVFIREMPEKIYERGGVAKIPWISTMAANEGHVVLYLLKLLGQYRYIKRDFRKYAPSILNLRYLTTAAEKGNSSKINLKEITEKLIQFYFRGITSTTQATDEMMSNMVTDRFFLSSFEKALRLHAKLAPTYAYLVNYQSSNYGSGKFMNIRREEWGIAHGDDLMYYHNMSTYGSGYRRKDPEYKLSKILINVMLNFFSNGTPSYTRSGEGDDQIQIWDQVNFDTKISSSASPFQILSINQHIRMIPFPEEYRQRAQFWDSLGLEDTKPLQMTSKMGPHVNEVRGHKKSFQNIQLSGKDSGENFIIV